MFTCAFYPLTFPVGGQQYRRRKFPENSSWKPFYSNSHAHPQTCTHHRRVFWYAAYNTCSTYMVGATAEWMSGKKIDKTGDAHRELGNKKHTERYTQGRWLEHLYKTVHPVAWNTVTEVIHETRPQNSTSTAKKCLHTHSNKLRSLEDAWAGYAWVEKVWAQNIFTNFLAESDH